MSSTKRNKGRALSPDYYRTPIEAILDFFDEFELRWDKVLKPPFTFDDRLMVLDPCAGGDTDNPMSYPVAIRNHRLWNKIYGLETVDIREDSRAEYKASYFDYKPKIRPNVIMTNPPFNIATPIIEKALRDVVPGGIVIGLQRLNFLGGDLRVDFWKKNMPVAIFVHSKRMAFSDFGSTDSIEYAHFVWQQGRRVASAKTYLVFRTNQKLKWKLADDGMAA